MIDYESYDERVTQDNEDAEMRERKKFKAYVYACESHPVGEFVRLVGVVEGLALAYLSDIAVPHADSCWIQGCQHPVFQVRLVEVQKSE